MTWRNDPQPFWLGYKETPSGCWEWQRCRNNDGYGTASREFYGEEKAHRIAWTLVHGDIPKGLWVLHKCDNRACVNPAHLFLGDHKANMADMSAKGRRGIPTGSDHWANKKPWLLARGSKNGFAVLDEQQVIEIRIRARAGEPRKRLAADYGLSKTALANVVTGRTWKHVPFP